MTSVKRQVKNYARQKLVAKTRLHDHNHQEIGLIVSETQDFLLHLTLSRHLSCLKK